MDQELFLAGILIHHHFGIHELGQKQVPHNFGEKHQPQCLSAMDNSRQVILYLLGLLLRQDEWHLAQQDFGFVWLGWIGQRSWAEDFPRLLFLDVCASWYVSYAIP